MTELLFREDGYLRSCTARVVGVDERGIRLDRTVFYPLGGGQAGDTGKMSGNFGNWRVIDTRKGPAPEQVLQSIMVRMPPRFFAASNPYFGNILAINALQLMDISYALPCDICHPFPGDTWEANAAVGFLALSPDAGQIVMRLNQGADQQLWIRPLDADQARLLRGTLGARSPFWSAWRSIVMSKSIADMMPSPNSSPISAFHVGPLTITSS